MVSKELEQALKSANCRGSVPVVIPNKQVFAESVEVIGGHGVASNTRGLGLRLPGLERVVTTHVTSNLHNPTFSQAVRIATNHHRAMALKRSTGLISPQNASGHPQ